MSRIIVKLTDDELESLVNGRSVTACLSPYADYSNLQAVTIVRKTELTVKKYIDDSKEEQTYEENSHVNGLCIHDMLAYWL